MKFQGIISIARSLVLSPFIRDPSSRRLVECTYDKWKHTIGSEKWHRLSLIFNEKLIILGQLFTKQCNVYAAQRIRRMAQIWNLYGRLYSEKSIRNMVDRLGQKFKFGKSKPLYLMLGAALFSWEKERITDEELQSCLDEMQNHCFLKQQSLKGNFESWHCVVDKLNIQVWRKPVPNCYLYEYKVCGTFYDIPARAFFNTQIDLDYRKKWDKLVIELQIVDKEEESGSEVLHWIMHYPYPMYSRDYVYVRRYMIDHENKLMVLVSRATEHPKCQISKDYVRVKSYNSRMVIKPHKSFDEMGFDYILTYFDDPQAMFPSPAYNWMASTGVPDFVDKLHMAAKDLYYGKYRQRPCEPNTAPDSSGRISAYA